jgi:hypothetical protein
LQLASRWSDFANPTLRYFDRFLILDWKWHNKLIVGGQIIYHQYDVEKYY